MSTVGACLLSMAGLLTLALICRVIKRKASSTFCADLAEASKNDIPSPSANSLASLKSTTFFVCEISFVSHQQFVYRLASVSINLAQPLLNVIE